MSRKKKFIFYNSPEHWLQTALELDDSVRILVEKTNGHYYQNMSYEESDETVKRMASSRAIALLMSYTLENLLKGIAILRNANLINTGRLDKSISTHQLNKLADLTGFELEPDQITFQKKLSELCLSNARYPVGLTERLIMDNPSFGQPDYELYKELFFEYRSTLTDEFHENGWYSGFDDENSILIHVNSLLYKYVDNS